MVIRVDPAQETAIRPIDDRIRAGRLPREAPAGEVALGYELAEDLEVEVGDRLVAFTQAADGSLRNTLFTVVGILRTGDEHRPDGRLRAHHDLRELLVLPDQLHAVTIVTSDERRIDDCVARLRARTWRRSAPRRGPGLVRRLAAGQRR
ncbi:MAG: hypothetical protein R3F59_19845 [Myxococcota bacterium]